MTARYSYGAKHSQRLKDTIMLGLKVATIISLIIFAVIIIFPSTIIHIFSWMKRP
ncbi:MATE family efflux transporter [Salibacterium sp. K-3]